MEAVEQPDAPPQPDALLREAQITMAVHAYRDASANSGGEMDLWRPPLRSVDAAVLRDAPMIRARARDLIRNNPYAKNAVRMNRDAVSGTGVKLALKIVMVQAV